jgi:hypothetical protein
MNSLIMLLLVIGVGFSAYARARREGVWSWQRFAKAMLGAAALVALTAAGVVWLGSALGPEHALLVALIDLIAVAFGATALARWLRPKPPRGPA